MIRDNSICLPDSSLCWKLDPKWEILLPLLFGKSLDEVRKLTDGITILSHYRFRSDTSERMWEIYTYIQPPLPSWPEGYYLACPYTTSHDDFLDYLESQIIEATREGETSNSNKLL